MKIKSKPGSLPLVEKELLIEYRIDDVSHGIVEIVQAKSEGDNNIAMLLREYWEPTTYLSVVQYAFETVHFTHDFFQTEFLTEKVTRGIMPEPDGLGGNLVQFPLGDYPSARPGWVAALEECIAAAQSNSPAAIALFLERHPENWIEDIFPAVTTPPPVKGSQLRVCDFPSARPGWVAIIEEFLAAAHLNTDEAWNIFHERHPGEWWSQVDIKSIASAPLPLNNTEPVSCFEYDLHDVQRAAWDFTHELPLQVGIISRDETHLFGSAAFSVSQSIEDIDYAQPQWIGPWLEWM
jgi:hypothetical protein